MHDAARSFVRDTLARLGARPATVVEIGSRRINGSVRELFDGAAYTGIDVRHGPGVDVVADGATWQPPASVDCVVCCEVLEHAPAADAILANAVRMLVPGGLLLVTCATDPRPAHSSVTGGALFPGEYYRNVAPAELTAWLAPHLVAYGIVEPQAGDLCAWGRR